MTRNLQRIAMIGQQTPLWRKAARVGMIGICFHCVSGCRTLAAPQDLTPQDLASPNPIQQTSGSSAIDESAPAPAAADDLTMTERARKTSNQMMNFISGREQEDLERAKELYKEGDSLFRQASSQDGKEKQSTFRKASKLFRRAGEAAPGTALQQDAMFMQGESLFFADRLVDASEVYERLQEEFPRNRHIDQVAGRLFAISRYWIETAEADKDKWVPINLTDAKKPRLDVDGHAIRVLDQIRYDDPTGRLADDATMAAAAEFIRQEKFEEADEFLTDLREAFADSEHAFFAHLLGINVKLENYRGPKYSGLVLEEADELVQRTRELYPDRLQQKDYAERVEKAAATVAYLKAERIRYRAEYRETRRDYGAARYYYNLLVQRYPETPHADSARERLAKIETYPAQPPQRLSWLTTVFPDSTSTGAPLEMSIPGGETEEPKTLLR